MTISANSTLRTTPPAIATARLHINDQTTEGADGPDAVVNFPAYMDFAVQGSTKRVAFRNDFGEASAFSIVGKRDFDKTKPHELHNWNLLDNLRKLPEFSYLNEVLTMSDPDADAEDALKRNEMELELREMITRHQGDEEWINKVYRVVVGQANGIPLRAKAVALLNRAKDNVSQFVTTSGRWVYEDKDFENRALLRNAIERQLLFAETGTTFIKKKDGSVFASDEAKALYLIENDSTVRADLLERIAQPMAPRRERQELQLEDSSIIRFLNDTGETVPTTTFAEDGSVDLGAMNARADEELRILVEKLSEAGLLTGEDGAYRLAEIQTPFISKDEVSGFLKTNPDTLASYKKYITI